MKTKRSESMPEIIFAGKGFLSTKNSSESLKLLKPRIGRLRNLTIIRLQKENNEMRDKLKEMNEKLSVLIDRPKNRPEKIEKIEKIEKVGKIEKNEKALEGFKNIEKELEYYKKEYLKVKNRCDAVKDSVFVRNLEEDVEKKAKTVKDLEDSIKKLKIFIKSKEKSIASLSTSEENYEHIKQLQVYTEKVLYYQKKLKKCADQSAQTKETLKKLQDKSQNLENQISIYTQKLETLNLDLKDPTSNPKTQDLKHKNKKLLTIALQKTSKQKIFHIKIKNLTELLDMNKLTEQSLQQKFENLSVCTKSNYSTLNNIIEKGSLSTRNLKNSSLYNKIFSTIKEP